MNCVRRKMMRARLTALYLRLIHAYMERQKQHQAALDACWLGTRRNG